MQAGDVNMVPSDSAEITDAGADKILVSVVIPTRNRARLLQEVVEALWGQTLDPELFEIIIVDNRSTDETPRLVQEWARRSPCRMVYHCMEENRGPTPSRNRGVELARGALIAFTDSDCRPVPEWLALGAEAMRDEKVGLVTGQVLYKPEQRVRFFSRASGEAKEEHPSYPTCNAWYRRAVFLQLGGFDMALCFRDFRSRPVECADSDLAWRVKEAGHLNVFVPGMVVYHEVEQLPPMNWAAEPFRLFVVPALVRRHPQLRRELLKWRLFFFPQNVLFYLGVVGVGLAIFLHWAFVALAVPFAGWAARAGNPNLSWRDLHRMLARIILIGARQACMCAGLIYGSIRFRSLVL